MNDKGSRVAWTCQYCGAIHTIEYATDKKSVRCDGCLTEHIVTGLHIDGSPQIRLSYRKEEANHGSFTPKDTR